MLDVITLYTSTKKENYTKMESGVSSTYSVSKDIEFKNTLHFSFPIKLQANESKEYYLELSSNSCALYLELKLLTQEEFYKKEVKHQLILALFFGAILTLILYNFSIFLFTRERAYLYYTLYLLFTMINHISYSSFSRYTYSLDFQRTDIYLSLFYISFLLIFTTLFTKTYLNTKRYKKLDMGLKISLLIFVLIMLISSPSFYPLDLTVLLGLLTLLYNFFVSAYLLYKGESNAKYMVFGWSIATIGWLNLGFYDSGLPSLLYIYPYFFEAAIFTEAILFSIALSAKLNKTKELELAMQRNTLLTQELHHRVKNNMQMIISIYRLKLSKYINVEMSDSLKEVEGTIQAMSSIHEMLYSAKDEMQIDTKEYIKALVKNLTESQEESKVAVELQIDTELDMQDSIYLGIILNELLTNSLKYAFSKEGGAIHIQLTQERKRYRATFGDNGKGFDINRESEGFGLELVKSLVEDELKGKISIDAKSGVKVVMKW
jgi:two-component sensor histidine kinase